MSEESEGRRILLPSQRLARELAWRNRRIKQHALIERFRMGRNALVLIYQCKDLNVSDANARRSRALQSLDLMNKSCSNPSLYLTSLRSDPSQAPSSCILYASSLGSFQMYSISGVLTEYALWSTMDDTYICPPEAKGVVEAKAGTKYLKLLLCIWSLDFLSLSIECGLLPASSPQDTDIVNVSSQARPRNRPKSCRTMDGWEDSIQGNRA